MMISSSACKKWFMGGLLALGLYFFLPIFGLFLGQSILPAQGWPKPTENPAIFQRQLRAKIPSQLTASFLQVVTPDGAILDTLQLSNPQSPPQSYLIFFCGNNMAYKVRLPEFQKIIETIAPAIIAFDYRNVHYSQGRVYSKQELLNDGIAQVQRLLNAGVAAENITLHGLSLGGGLASLVAAHFHSQSPAQKVYLVADRTFPSLTDAVLGKVLPELGYSKARAPLRALGRAILKPFIQAILLMTNWEINCLEAYNRIPAQYKALITAKNDMIIDYQVASLEHGAINGGKVFHINDSYKGPSLHAHPLYGLKDEHGRDMLDNLITFMQH